MSASLHSSLPRALGGVPRVCLGPDAPAEIADFLARAGLEVLSYANRHHAALYVDFVGARPGGIEVLSFNLSGRSPRTPGELTVTSWPAAATLVLSTALRLKPPLLSGAPAMLAVINSALAVAGSHVPVVLEGEIGTGKYNLARLIHAARRAPGELMLLHCANFEDADLRQTLRALTFTPAAVSAARSANAAMAAGPTIFLDELGELSETAQANFLQLLQAAERAPTVTATGAAVEPRFIAATNRGLAGLVERGELRRELYWRLNVFGLALPPLRQRGGDLPMLARYFLGRANPRRAFTPMALKVLAGYAFPGNTLELENLVARLAIAPLQTGNSLIDVADIRRHLMIVADAGEAPVSGWKHSREEARREMILKTIAAAGGNRAAAARRLGITLRALQYHITKAGLSRPRTRPGATPPTPVTGQSRKPLAREPHE